MSNIANFTGARHSPTIIDRQQLAEFIDFYTSNLEKNNVDGVGLIVTTSTGSIHVDWMLLAGANKHCLLSGTQLMVADLVKSFQNEVNDENS